MPKIVELRPDRAFICSNFDGYKLSLDAVPVLRQELNVAVHKAEPTLEQYSYLHAELFSTQNLLYVDPWERNDAYFVNNLAEIWRSSYNETTGRSKPLQQVYSLKSITDTRQAGDYNYSLRFVSEKFCVLCDGINALYLLETSDRSKATDWKLIAQTKVEIKLAAHVQNAQETLINRNFVILDARLDIIKEQKQISLALAHVQKLESVAEPDVATQHFMLIHWLQWTQLQNNWSLTVLETLQGKGSVYYCAFEQRAEALIISSNREFQFYTKILENGHEKSVQKEKAQFHEVPPENYDHFSWSQTDEDVLISFNAQENCEKTDYQINCSSNNLHVKCGQQQLLQHELFADVDHDLTTWNVENNQLQVTLIKRQIAFYWPHLFSDGAGPKETIDKDAATRTIPTEQQPIVNLEAPIEDCDFPVGLNEDDIKIERFHLPSKSVTHAVLLSSNAPLFSTILRPGFPNAFAVRQDVDAGLWLQCCNANKPEEWTCRHEGNLHAFGYVQASKQQKKFMDCAPDLSYAVICEATRHIFLYKSKHDSANSLRNRSGPQVTLGKQHLISLDPADEILGLSTANSVITILTTKAVLHLQL